MAKLIEPVQCDRCAQLEAEILLLHHQLQLERHRQSARKLGPENCELVGLPSASHSYT